jgi:hypothetical protein
MHKFLALRHVALAPARRSMRRARGACPALASVPGGMGALQGAGWGPEFRVVTRARRPRRSLPTGWRRFMMPSRVAAELGHTSPQMLYSTYRELVLPDEAERYWKIAPAAETENVVAFGEAARP